MPCSLDVASICPSAASNSIVDHALDLAVQEIPAFSNQAWAVLNCIVQNFCRALVRTSGRLAVEQTAAFALIPRWDMEQTLASRLR